MGYSKVRACGRTAPDLDAYTLPAASFADQIRPICF